MNNRDILYWYCLEIFPDRLFYDEVSDLIAIYSHDENTLNIYDLISPEPINYPEIVAALQTDATGETVFHFNLECDELELQQRMFRSDEEDDPMFVRGDLDMASFTYPVTAHT
ncbi:hypothetical protein [Salinispira pacifica]|uniref:hypothetical protein n=1 Tax=Salinispira pacifica TaxID=1307761 RepID=UPI000409CB78|nr:hypothetical protein [Salinispira pacifica]